MDGLNDTCLKKKKSRLCLKTIYPIKLYICGKNAEVVAHKLTDVLEKNHILAQSVSSEIKRVKNCQWVSWSAQFSHQRALSLSHCLCVLDCVSHHPLHSLLVHYCQRFIIDIDTLASPYVYLVRFVFSCVSIAFCSCVAFFVSCFCTCGLCFFGFWK